MATINKRHRCQAMAYKVLSPLIRAGDTDPSLYSRIADEMTRLTGNKYHRQEIGTWLHPDKDKRIEPRLGAGMMLLNVGWQLIEATAKEEPRPEKEVRMASFKLPKAVQERLQRDYGFYPRKTTWRNAGAMRALWVKRQKVDDTKEIDQKMFDFCVTLIKQREQ